MKQYRLKKRWIEKIRKQYTLQELSAVLGFSNATVCNILRGRYLPSKAFILNVCDKFQLKFSDFLTEVR
jgi:transcriptional regulator with XRE-family HTH domain